MTRSAGSERSHIPSEERFLVTGSDGCIGSWVVRSLAGAGVEVVATDVSFAAERLGRLLDESTREHVTVVACDITEPMALDRLVTAHGITRIVHLAALQIPFVAANPLRGAEVNVVGTVRVFEAARGSGGSVRGVAYASSGAVFGIEDPNVPDTLYGAFKLCNEASAGFYARDYDTPSIGLRPCVVYGPNRDQGLTAAITHAMKAAVLGVPYTIPFGGRIDLQYAEDVAWSFIRAALAPSDGAGVFDLHGELVAVSDVVALVAREAPDAGDLITHLPDPIPGRVEFDDAPLLERVGDLPKTPLEDGIRATLALFRQLRDDGRLTTADLPSDPATVLT